MQVVQNKILDNVILLFFFFTLLTLPFDSLPYLFLSTYRPLSIIFIVLCSPLVLLKYVINYRGNFIWEFFNKYFFILLFFIFTVPISYYSSYRFGLSYVGSHDFFITLTLGLLAFIVLCESISILLERFKSNEVLIKSIFTLIAYIYIPVLLIGIIELLVITGVAPFEIKQFFIGWAVPFIHDRIQLFSAEASWASMHLIFIIPIYFYLLKGSKLYYIPLMLSLGLLMFSFSMQGILTLIIAVSILFIFYFRNIKPSYFIYVFGFIIALVLIWILIKNIYGEVYFLTRIYNLFKIEKLSDILYLDGSVFVRLVYPSLAFLMGFDYPLFGIGGGNYRFFFVEYLSQYFSRGLQFPEVLENYLHLTGNSKNMLARLFGETGIIGTFMFLGFIYSVMTKVNQVNPNIRVYLIIWSVFVFANLMQFDSFVYMHLWVMMSVIYSLKKEYTYENENI